jgi:hypothetical protein
MNISIFKDKNILLFFTNVFLVILGYFLAVITNFQSVSFMKLFKTIVLIISILGLLKTDNFRNLKKFNIKSFFLFSCWILITILWSENPSESFSKYAIFIPPLFYIILFVVYLSSKYGYYNSKKILDKIFIITYLFPIFYFIIFVRNFNSEGIYGISNETQGFVSNHYGWSASIIVLYFFTMFQNGGRLFKIIDYVLFFTSFVILVLSSNRAGFVAVVIAFAIHLIPKGKLKFKKVIINLIIFLGLFFFVYQQLIIKESALGYMIEKSTNQLENDSEARFVIASYSFNLMVNDFSNLIFGFGFFDDQHISGSGYNFSSYHNSYLDIFFGIGIFGMIIFLRTFFLNSILFLIKNIRNYYHMIPILIIPYFESNATSGQFLFFPWFTYLIFTTIQYNYKK